ncbi:cell division control protein 45 homolog isoform X1 [Macrosteles quadrilineatus]|uniref:cell division control protein 45 homolog isoform X1 n=1 Tax=Macrosteles quadrilineatus TaxID=74068 RepID=UPI0023E17557|nr:cell division control protein 45 homolog isoform X1 [Macrosteles quadrilineatus]
MYVHDIVNDFYKKIIGKKVLVFANCDIDAACSCKILQWLFQCDSIVYSLVPVQGIQDMITAYEEHASEVKYVILVNCGGTLDIVEILQPEPDVIFYIVDNHRPTDVCNIYNNEQIYIVPKPGDEETIPDFDDIFGNDDTDEEVNSEEEEVDSETEGESRGAKRQRLNEASILRQRERRLWEEKRNRIMFDYTQFTYYGRSSAILMYELAWKLSKDNVDVLWWGIVGVTSQLVLRQVTVERYQSEIERITLHIGRLCPPITTTDDDQSSVHSRSETCSNYTTATRVTGDKDLSLTLYRHWTVEQSLRHSLETATRLRLWTIRGEKRLQQLLAEMGLPLVESRQLFSAMDLSLRRQFHTMMDKMAESHQLDVVFSSFTLHHGCRRRYQAMDFVFAMLALFNPTEKEIKYIDCFQDAVACLSRQHRTVLEEGIERAKKLLTILYRQTHNALDMKQIISAGPFLYMVIQEGSLDACYYSEPTCLGLLAQVALRAYVQTSRKKAAGLPLIVSAPLHGSPGHCIVLGVPPVAEAVPRNFFGKAFEQAAEKTNSQVELEYFDSSVMRMKVEDRAKFFDALTALLS